MVGTTLVVVAGGAMVKEGAVPLTLPPLALPPSLLLELLLLLDESTRSYPCLASLRSRWWWRSWWWRLMPEKIL